MITMMLFLFEINVFISTNCIFQSKNSQL